MIQGILGKKIGMTQVNVDDMGLVPVTLIEVGPCFVVQKKDPDRDGYSALQLSFQPKKERKVSKAMIGHFKKAGVSPMYFLREVDGGDEAVQLGQEIRVEIFKKGEMVDVTGISRGKGFAGVMKRHNFSGGPAGHGSQFHRAPGSIGASSFPSRVFKNQKLPGHMGSQKKTVERLRVIDVHPEENLLIVKGAVPGSPGTLLMVRRSKKTR